MNKILILSPTFMEIERVFPFHGSQVNIAITGIGGVKAAYNTKRYVDLYAPDIVLLVGIAGAYESGGLTVGETVLVQNEVFADMGSFDNNGDFRAKFSESIMCPYIPENTLYKCVTSNSVNGAAAPFINTRTSTPAQIENMEGAAFFYVCSQENVRFLELRTISNIVGEPFEKWDILLATENLANEIKLLTDEIKA